jgi:hypothetical protein
MRKVLTVCFAVLFATWAVPSFGQRTSASIRGAVTDTTGAVVPGVTVTVKSVETGFSRSTVTNSDGLYSFEELPLGTYSVDFSISGFKSAARTGIVLNVADVRAVNVQLEPGAISETVTVQSDALAVKTIGGEVAGLVTGEQVRELPLNGRNFLQLGTLMPGVSQGDTFNTKDRGLMSGIELAVSGSSLGGNMWTVDGANNNDVGSNRTILVFPSVDAIDEFKVHRNSYGAEFGGAAGAQVNIVTRAGTNQFHGSGYYFGRNDALASSDYFLKQAGQPKAPLSVHDFGGTFGGPIVKDKLQFFYSEEWNREKRGITRATFVPTALERTGDFSGPEIPDCSSPAPIDPLTGSLFPNNRIPEDRLSPAGLLVMQLYPLPNTTPGAGSCNNWVTALDTSINWRQENARVDYTLSNSIRMLVRYTQDSWTNSAPSAQETLWGDDPFPAVDSNWDQPGRSLTAQLNQNIGATMVNTLTFSYSANVITVERGGLTPELNNEINAAIPGVFPDSVKEYGADRGHPIFFGRGSYGDDLQNMAPFKNNQNLYAFKDDFSAVLGTHFLKSGIVVSYNQKNEDVFDQGSAESSQFGDAVGLTGNGDATGNVLADLLLRGMAFDFSEARSERSIQQRWRDVEAYVQDSWKVRPNVTVDYGLRWSRFENPYDAGDTISSFDPSTFDPALGSDACNGMLIPPGSTACQDAGLLGGRPGPTRALTHTKNFFAPRLGAAWDVFGDGKTAVRAGLGQFFQRESLQNGLNLGFNPPFNRILVGSRTLDSNAEPFPGAFATNDGIPQYGLDTSGQMGNNWQWNASVQREIWHNTTLEVGYVGSKGRDLLHPFDVNQVPPGDNNGNGVPDRLDFIHAGSDTDARAALRPFGVFGNASIAILDHSGHTTYHSLQAQLVSRFGRSSQFQASYTLSRTRGNVTLTGGENGVGAAAVSLNENPDLDEGYTETHRPHIFNASLVLGLPTLEQKSNLVKQVFGDWEVGTIVQASSGRPVTVFTGAIPGLTNRVSGTGLNANQRPNLVSGVDCHASGGPKEQFLNPDAWTLNGFELGTFGNSPRGVCLGPAFFQVDLAFFKNIRITDKVRAQFRFEVFNFFNRANFVGVNANLSPVTATLDTGDASTATRIVDYTPSGSFGQATATRDPRQAQFGIKLMF